MIKIIYNSITDMGLIFTHKINKWITAYFRLPKEKNSIQNC